MLAIWTPKRQFRRSPLQLEELETRSLLSASSMFETLLNVQGQQLPVIADRYAITVTKDGLLSAQVEAPLGDTRLSLLTADNVLLLQSDGRSVSDRNDVIELHLEGSTSGTVYQLVVETLSGGGTYHLTANLATTLSPFEPLPVGTAPWSHIVADLNGDQHLDLAVANFNSNDVSILLGLGDGTFAPETRYAVGDGPNYIVAGDFNNDGHVDVATADLLAGTVSVLLGEGTGVFSTQTSIAFGGTPGSLTAGHFNGDAFLDLAVTDYSTGRVGILLGGTGGSFQTAPEFYDVGAGPYAVQVGDFNNDGALDLVTANYGAASVSLLLGQGNGRFTIPTVPSFAVGDGPYTITVGDFNGDQLVDLATANFDSNDVSVLLNLGVGQFAPQVRLAAGRGANGIVTAQLNRDAHLDLAVANYSEGTMSVFMGVGDGSFVADAVLPLGADPTFLAAGDFDEDGTVDLAGVSITPGNVHVLLNRGDGTFDTGSRQAPGAEAYGVTSGDLNGDGYIDLVTVNYAASDIMVQLGRGDGTYRFHGRFATETDPETAIVGDFNGDQRLDLIVTNFSSTVVTLLVGDGRGSFGAPLHFEVGYLPLRAVAGYFNDDEHLDLVTADYGSNTVSVLLGRGSEASSPAELFSPRTVYTVGTSPMSLTTGHFDSDDTLDLAVANFGSGDVTILAGDGQGGFTELVTVVTGGTPRSIVAGDFGGDNRTDFAVADPSANRLAVFLNDANLGFVSGVQLSTGASPFAVLTGDFDATLGADLVTVNRDGASLTVFLRSQGGGFAAGVAYAVGEAPFSGLVNDLNGDGIADLAAVNFSSSDVSVLLGQGDGTFDDQRRIGIVSGPTSIVEADFNGDGNLDLATSNPYTGEVLIQFGLQGGIFHEPTVISIGGTPRALTTGDFNRDGRPDLAVADYLSGQVSILLGFGDGTFRVPLHFGVEHNPTALTTGDFNADGNLDLAVANYGANTISLLLGRGDGTCLQATSFVVGTAPSSILVGDVNGDGRLDLVVGNEHSDDISILLSLGNGGFQSLATVALPASPASLVAADFDDDGRLDLAAAHPGDRTVSLLFGLGNGTFQSPQPIALTLSPSTLLAVDVDDDNSPSIDLVVASDSGNAVMLRGDGRGGFQTLAAFELGDYPLALVAVDFNGDHHPDLASVSGLGEPLSVVLGTGSGTFEPAEVVGRPVRNTPLVADYNRDGFADVAVLRRDGVILVRMGRPNGIFDSPVIINPEPEFAARDVTLLSAYGQYYLTTLETHGDTLSTYVVGPTGTFLRYVSVPVYGSLPGRVVAGDLNGDSLEDVIVAASGSREVIVGLQRPDGTGVVNYRLPVGHSPSDIALLDIDGQFGLDIAVTDQFSGDVRIFLNDPLEPFARQLRYQTGSGLYSVREYAGAPALYSREMPVALVGIPGNSPGFIAVNSGGNSITVLVENGLGGLLNAEGGNVLPTGLHPIAAVTGLFNNDAFVDIAVLNEGSRDISVYLGNHSGGFDVQPVRLFAGNLPGGLTAHDVNNDQHLDLLVGNERGDVLILLGNGNGTFNPYERADHHRALAVADLNGDGTNDFIVADAALDRVGVEYSTPGMAFRQDRVNGVRNPEEVKLADLNRDGRLDLILVNSGSNDVLVYQGLPDGQFAAALTFFAGMSPSGVTVHDLDGNGWLDLVVTNAGSNDVSILLSQTEGTAWTLTPGPRLQAGNGPVASVVHDVTGDGVADLLVGNSRSHNVFILPGVGGGFFDDRTPTILPTGAIPRGLFVGNFDTQAGVDLIVINAGSGDLSFFSGMGSETRLDTGSVNPMAFLPGDFNNDGLDDLVVLSHQDARLSLLLGGTFGPQLASVITSPQLIQPSDLALANLSDSSLEVYVATEGTETVVTLSFALDLAPVLPNAGSSLYPTQDTSEFTSLSGAPLEFVPVLLFVPSDEGTLADAGENSETDNSAARLNVAGNPHNGDGALESFGEASDEDGEPIHSPDGLANEVEDVPTPLNSFLLGVDELPFEKRFLDRSTTPQGENSPLPQNSEVAPPLGVPETMLQPALLDEVFQAFDAADTQAVKELQAPVSEPDSEFPAWLPGLALANLALVLAYPVSRRRTVKLSLGCGRRADERSN